MKTRLTLRATMLMAGAATLMLSVCVTANAQADSDRYLDARIQLALDDASNGFRNMTETAVGPWRCGRSYDVRASFTTVDYACETIAPYNLEETKGRIVDSLNTHLQGTYYWREGTGNHPHTVVLLGQGQSALMELFFEPTDGKTYVRVAARTTVLNGQWSAKR